MLTLSDGQPCEVRQLRIFELREVIKPPLSGAFTYEVDIGGKIVKAAYHIPDTPPEITSTDPNRAIWQQNEVDYYRAAIARADAVTADAERYHYDIAAYILANCVVPTDRPRIVNTDDFRAVYHAALVPQLTLADLESAATRIFQASFDSMPILEALMSGEGGKTHGQYDPVALWEVQTMGDTPEEEWGKLSLSERARKVVGRKLDDWMSALQWQKDKESRGK